MAVVLAPVLGEPSITGAEWTEEEVIIVEVKRLQSACCVLCCVKLVRQGLGGLSAGRYLSI